jgi:hypothetical protein
MPGKGKDMWLLILPHRQSQLGEILPGQSSGHDGGVFFIVALDSVQSGRHFGVNVDRFPV